MSCLICKKDLSSDVTCTVKWKGLRTLIKFSKAREDHLDEVFCNVESIILHNTCRQRYTKARRWTDDGLPILHKPTKPPKPFEEITVLEGDLDLELLPEKTEDDPNKPFPFEKRCFLCASCISKGPIGRTRTITEVNYNYLLRNFKKNRTTFNLKAERRIKNVDLLAIKPLIHSKCLFKTYAPVYHGKRGRSQCLDIEKAMNHIYMYIDKSNQKEFTMMELQTAIKNYYIPSGKTIQKKVLEKYGNNITITDFNDLKNTPSFREEFGFIGSNDSHEKRVKIPMRSKTANEMSQSAIENETSNWSKLSNDPEFMETRNLVKVEHDTYEEQIEIDEAANIEKCNNISKPFPFQHKCFFCEEEFYNDKKRGNFRSNVIQIKYESTQTKLISSLEKNSLPEYESILRRIRDVDLVAVKAMYHKKCYTSVVYHNVRVRTHVFPGRRRCPEVAAAMNVIYIYMEESNQTEFGITELKSVLKSFKPSNKTILTKIKDKFGDRVVIKSQMGHESVVILDKEGSSNNYGYLATPPTLVQGSIQATSSENFTDTFDDDKDDFDNELVSPIEPQTVARKTKNKVLKHKSRKEESRDKEDYEINLYCQACLCSDRTLDVLGEYEEFYRRICVDDLNVPVYDSKTTLKLFCWECRALLRNVKRFHERVMSAQRQLYLHHTQKATVSRLSTLAIVKPDEIDEILKRKTQTTENKNTDEPIIEEVCKEEVGNIKEEAGNIKEEGNTIEVGNTKEDDNSDTNLFQTENLNDECDKISESFDDIDDETTLMPTDDKKLRKVLKKRNKSINMSSKSSSDESSGRNSPEWTPQKRNIKKSDTPKEIQTDTLYRVVEVLDVNEKIIRERIGQQDVAYWRERERNSVYFRLLEDKCERCLEKIPPGDGHDTLFHLSDNPYVCTVCSRTFASESSLLGHVTQHLFTLRCGVCGFICCGEQHMRDHVRTQHSTIVRCIECGYTFKNVVTFKEHYKNLHREYVCDYCGKKVPHKLGIARHIQRMHMPIECRVCVKKFKSYTHLKHHMNIKHLINRTEAAYCVQCDIQFNNEFLYKQHVYHSTRHIKEQKRIIPKPKKESITCPQCPNVYSSKYSFRNHFALIHAKQINYLCHYCNKAFPRKYGLQCHLRTHEGYKHPKNKFCKMCGQGFSTNRILINHIRTHTGERPYKCSYCEAAFAQKIAWKTHVNNKHLKTTAGPPAQDVTSVTWTA